MLTNLLRLSIPEILMRLTIVPVVIAGIIGIQRFRWLPANLRYLVGLIGFILPLEIIEFVLMFQHRNNLFLMPICAIGEFWLLALVYCRTLQSATFTRVMPWLVAGFTAYVLFDSVLAGRLTQFRPGQQVIQDLLVLVLVGLYFRKLLHELQVKQLKHEPMFWVSAGLLIYCLGYLQIALFSNYLLHYSDQLNMNIWALHSLLFIVLYTCYSLALWLSPRK